MSLLSELRRRNVTRAAAAYAALAWLLIQVGDAVFEAFGFGEGAQRYLILGLAIGFVPAMVLAWAFELTPAGLVREADLAADAPLRARTNRVLDRLIIGLLALALGYFGVDKFLLAPAREATRIDEASKRAAEQATRETLRDARGTRTIAVLPFDNMSADPEQEYFSDGISEEVLNLLARIPELSVTSRTSAFAFKGKDTGLAEIAQQLGVSCVLEGSVRKQGSRVRITAQLIDARSDTHLWSETYDRTLEDVFAVQDDVAAQVVGQLRLKLLGELPRARSTNPQAHEHLLRARQWMRSWVIDDVVRAQAEIRAAIALDPGYAEAYALLADALLIGVPSEAERPRAKAAAAPLVDKALAIDPKIGEAWVTRGHLEEDVVEAEAQMRRGLELSPSYARGWEVLAGLVSEQPGRGSEGLELIDRARVLDPLLPRNHHMKAMMLGEFGDLGGARQLWEQTLALDPRFRSALAGMGNFSRYAGDIAPAVAYYERALAIDPQAEWVRDSLVSAYLELDDTAAARAVNQPPGSTRDWAIRIAEDGDGAAIERLQALEAPARAVVDPQFVVELMLRHASSGGDAARARDIAVSALGFDGRLPEGLWYMEAEPYIRLACLLQQAGDTAAARRLWDDLDAFLDAEQQRVPGIARILDAQRAAVRAHLGDSIGALAALERATTPVPSAWSLVRTDDPLFAPLRGEPRFRAVVERVDTHRARAARCRAGPDQNCALSPVNQYMPSAS